MSMLMPAPHYVDYCSFVGSSESRACVFPVMVSNPFWMLLEEFPRTLLRSFFMSIQRFSGFLFLWCPCLILTLW
jgi:hypothetical protein